MKKVQEPQVKKNKTKSDIKIKNCYQFFMVKYEIIGKTHL